jgi:lipopolysaccharide export system permease protein
LDKAIFRELLSPFVFGSLAFLCLLLGIETLFDLIKLAAREHFTLGEVGQIFVCRLPKMIAFTFPMSTLLAAVLGYNRLSGDGEITAMRAAGISVLRIEVVGVVFAAFVACLAYVLTEAVVPRAESAAELATLAAKYKHSAAEDVYLRIPTEGPIRRVVIAREFDYQRAVMTDVAVVEFEQDTPRAAKEAKTGVWRGDGWELRDVRYKSGPLAGVTKAVERLAPHEDSPLPRDVVGRPKRKTEMDRRELSRRGGENRKLLEVLRRAGMSTDRAVRHGRDLAIHYQLRLAVPVSCIAFALVGMPLGIRSRRANSSMSFGIAVLIVLGYYIFFNLINVFGQGGMLPPLATAWLANAIAIVVGVALSIKVAR